MHDMRRVLRCSSIIIASASIVVGAASGPLASGATPSSAAVRLAWSVAPHATFGNGILPPHNPSENIPLHPNFEQSGTCSASNTGALSCQNPCVSTRGIFPVYSNTPACTRYVLRAINFARAAEHVTPMVLPTNWYRLTVLEQLFVLADLERTSRGLPPYLGINAGLSQSAEAGAQSASDPVPAARPVHGSWGSTWAIGFSPLEADYGWMYDDGWGGSKSTTWNFTCTSSTSTRCWDHRDILLGSYVGLECRNCEMGLGFSTSRGYGSFTDLVVQPADAAPAMNFTWVKNVKPYL
jgi:hypothetical protein